MRQRPTAIFIVLICGLAVFQVSAADTDSATANLDTTLVRLLPRLRPDEIEILTEKGELSFPYGLDGRPEVSVRLAPAFAEEIESDLRSLEPSIGVEVLFLVDAPPGISGIDARLLTTLQSISTMEGIEYYSASRDRMRTLFYESYVIEGPNNHARRSDPVATTPAGAAEQIHIFQRDSSFGRNVLELTYTTTDDAVRLRMRNLSRMYYQGIVPAVAPEHLGLNLVVVPLGEQVLFYGNSAARPIGLFGMESRVQRSFYNRLVSLYRWFLAQSG